MDYNKLAKVADFMNGNKQNVTAEARQVVDEKSPLDALEERDHITDCRNTIIDDVFIKRFNAAPRSERRKFLARLTDSERRRVLTMINRKKINDSGFSETLGFILLDDLLANVIYDPTDYNIKVLDEFIASQNYTDFSSDIKNLVEQVKSAEDNLNVSAVNEIKSALGSRESRVAQIVGESEDVDDFQLPEEEDLTDDDLDSLSDSAKSHVTLFVKNKNFKEVTDAAEEVIAEFQGKNRRYNETSDAYWKAFESAWKEQYSEGQEFEQHNAENTEIIDSIERALHVIGDDVLDDVFDGPTYDENGNEVHDVQEDSIVKLLSEALEAYVSGDTSKLDALAQTNLESDVEVQEEPEEEPDSPFDQEEPDEEQVQDSIVHFARRLLKGKSVNKLVDSLKDKCKILQTLNLKKTDCAAPYVELPEQTDVVNMPLSREEFYSVYGGGIPAVMVDLIEAMPKSQVPPVCSHELCGSCVDINNGQLYYPYTCSAEELENRLASAEENDNLQEIVGSCAVPLKDAMNAAAKCEALNLIDTRFYKSSLTDSAWTFDEDNKPEVIKDCKGSRIERSMNPNVTLFGVGFRVS